MVVVLGEVVDVVVDEVVEETDVADVERVVEVVEEADGVTERSNIVPLGTRMVTGGFGPLVSGIGVSPKDRI